MFDRKLLDVLQVNKHHISTHSADWCVFPTSSVVFISYNDLFATFGGSNVTQPCHNLQGQLWIRLFCYIRIYTWFIPTFDHAGEWAGKATNEKSVDDVKPNVKQGLNVGEKNPLFHRAINKHDGKQVFCNHLASILMMMIAWNLVAMLMIT